MSASTTRRWRSGAKRRGHSRKYLHQPQTASAKLADRAASLIGSWPFLIAQSCILACWVLVNAVHLAGFDPPPFILLNLMLSFQAAFTGPVLLIAANRSAQIDRARDDHEAKEVDELHSVNQTQLEILLLLKDLQQTRDTQDAKKAA